MISTPSRLPRWGPGLWANAVSFVNACVATPGIDAPVAASIRFSSRVLSIGESPKPHDLVVDLRGAIVLPGLINAHDHLELNHYGRLKGRDRYENASAWIDDIRPRLSADPTIRDGRAHPLVERLFIGGLKNLLAGVTMVAHHNPFYPEMRRTMPLRVVRRYGWAHSFLLERQPAGARGEPGGEVARRCQATPADAPFVVHLAEGVDEEARAELARLEALGCLKPNTVIVHGVAIDGDGWRRVARAGAGLVWCPSSNDFLFGRSVPVRALLDDGFREGNDGDRRPINIALGTDSRVTGSRDLLDELRAARDAAPVSPAELLRMVTTSAAALLRQSRSGRITVGGPADLVVIPPFASDPAAALLKTTRRDVRLVMVGGRPLVADPDMAAVFRARRVKLRPMRVDAAPKLADAGLVRRLAGCPIVEPGVTPV
jgi:cytosine/adenosine deaminase-related metal-dependent hydrolase